MVRVDPAAAAAWEGMRARETANDVNDSDKGADHRAAVRSAADREGNIGLGFAIGIALALVIWALAIWAVAS